MILNFYNQLFILFVIFNSISDIYSLLQCKDDLGNDVDWSVVYKIPKESKNYQSNGLQTVYVTSNGETSWTPSKYSINNIENIIGSTLLPLYTSSPSVNYILYSDQPNKGEHISDNGHSKGVLIFDSSSGFWLIHSVPAFPNDPKISPKYDYPASGEVNGQIFLCISFKTQAALPKIIHQLLYIRPHVYSNSVSETMVQQIPELAALINKKWIKQSYSQSDFETLGGQTFTSFSKSPSAHLDIYSQIAAPSLKIDLLAETWRKGAGGPLPSECNLTYQVVNIDQVSIIYPDKPAVWSYTEDHSKWAISVESNTPIVCVGDTNRMASQAKRGGGLVCMKNQKVWKALHSSVHQIESCPRTSSKKDKSIFTRIINFFTSIFTTKFSLPAKTLTKDRTKKELR